MTTNLDKKVNPQEKTNLDSLKIRIETSKIEITNIELRGTKITVLKETAEVLREFKDNALKFSNNGISTRFAIEIMPINSFGERKEYLTMLVNSKLLKSRYIEGITLDNIRLVYNELQSYKVAKFTFKDFLNGACTDIDFKTDRRVPMKDFEEVLQTFKDNSRLSQEKEKGYRPFGGPMNKGIEFSKRATTKFITNPFWKLYHKELELNSNSLEFKNCYLQDTNLKDLVRFEFTIKNKKHLKALELESNTLEYILNISELKKKEMLSNSIKAHLEGYKRTPIKNDGISPRDIADIMFITMQMEGGKSYEVIINRVLDAMPNKFAKSRMKKRFDTLYLEHIKGSKKDISTKNIAEVFTSIGLDGYF